MKFTTNDLRLLTVLAVLAAFVLSAGQQSVFAQKTGQSPLRYKKAIEKFIQQDKQSPPAKNGILFIGSSTIRMWDLEKCFPDRKAINRGFGGSEISDSIYYADQILFPYEPRVIVCYAGENDIAHDESPESVVADYQKLVGMIHKRLPNTRFVFISLKPSIARWKLVEKMRKTNRAIRKIIEQHPNQHYIDLEEILIGEDGKPKQELFLSDGLHYNAKGYQLLSEKIRPHLEATQ